MSRVLTSFVVATLVVGAGLAGWWAASVALAPPDDPLQGRPVDQIAYEVDIETIGRELRFQALAEWTALAGPSNQASGIVTDVALRPGSSLDPGAPVYFVDLRPVVAAEGTTPMFRDLRQTSEGPDVAQLQRMLSELGFLAAEADGVFSRATGQAVRDWQSSLGLDETGVVLRGDVVFVDSLPRPAVVGENIARGRQLNGGEIALRLLPEGPRFWIPLSSDQRSLVPSDAPVVVEHSGGEWDAVTAEVSDSSQGFGLEYVLEAPNGGPVCGALCTSVVPTQGVSEFEVRVVLIPETTGPGVPVAAIRTDVNGGPFVELASGEERPISVVESTGGTAIVSGINAGEVVLVPVTDG